MKWLIQALGKLLGIHFAGDNYVIPVLRLGRFSRLKGAGLFWIIPFIDQPLTPISTGLRVAKFVFNNVLSHDHIPFSFHLTILFTFNPHLPPKKVAAQLVRASDNLLQEIVQDYANQGLRRLASAFEARELANKLAISAIERNLTRFLTVQMHVLGIVPLRDGGVLIKETIAPEKFQRAMLNAKRLETVLQSLAHFPVHSLIEQALQAEFVTGLEELEGNLTLLSTLSPLEATYPPYSLDLNQLSRSTGQLARDGH